MTKHYDPLPVFCFKVTFQLPSMKGIEAYFKSVSGIRYETETIPFRQGGENDSTRMLVGGTKWSPLVLKKGFTKDSALLKWREEWLAEKRVRTSGTIVQLDTSLKPAASWSFHNGFPSKWEISEFDASKSELAIETLEITHERLLSTPVGG